MNLSLITLDNNKPKQNMRVLSKDQSRKDIKN
jgi:hypothetical protein